MRRSKFSLSHYRMFSSGMGNLIPIQCVPVIPGDTMQGQNSVLIRMSALNTPVMHPVQIRIDTWFVPYRVVDDEWENFITGANETDSPQLIPVTQGADKLGQFFDIQDDYTGTIVALPYKVYNKIYNQRYRDQDLVPEVAELNQDIQRCAWEKDYYTTARPWAAKGPYVSIPVSTDAGTGVSAVIADNNSVNNRVLDAGQPELKIGVGTSAETNLHIDPNDLRLGAALQRYAEARARYGSRFTEYLRYLGVRNPSDARLQEPELLGSGRGMVNFSEVLQTAPNQASGTSGGDGVGDLFGHGVAGVRTRSWRRFFEEHGIVMTLLSLRPKSVYQNIQPREWLKKTREDYYQKELVNIGQQPIWAAETFGNVADDYATWGWQDRYAEYRFWPSTVQGEFRGVLNTWHLARAFTTAPVLNQSFVECAPSDRIFQSSVTDTVYIMANNSLVARRMLPRAPRPQVV